MSNQKLRGLNNSRSPGSIVNAEHHDPSGAHRGIDGVPVCIKEVVADSSVATAVENQSIIRVFNTDAAVQFVWIGKEDEIPGTIDITTGIAIGPGESEVLFSCYSDDCKKSLVIKTSSTLVQVVVMEG